MAQALRIAEAVIFAADRPVSPQTLATVLPEGSQITRNATLPALPVPMVGHVTSSYFSPTVGRPIAMAVVRGGLSRMGEKVYIPLVDGRIVAATICSPVFYDPEGKRHHV
jgi:sarcosine oxidase subunit alpha